MQPPESPIADASTTPDATFVERLRAATALLQQVVADRGLLASLVGDDYRDFIAAVEQVYHPDAVARRRLVKETIRRRKAEKTRKDEEKLHQTGIRELRRKPVFTTPNYFPPPSADQPAAEPEAEPEFRGSHGPQHCYTC